ncbi:hypothetical protein ABZP36_008924 [Zizania latifolia]
MAKARIGQFIKAQTIELAVGAGREEGEAVTGNVVEVVRHMRSVMGDIRGLRNMDDDEVFSYAKRIATPYDLVMQTKHCFSLNHWLHIYTDTLLIVKGEV